jgi:hypothetical protein
MTPMRPMAPTPPGPPLHHDLLRHRRRSPARQRSQQTRNEEENAIHDAERPTGFQHRARLIDSDAKGVEIRLSEDAERLRVGLGGDRGAVVVADAAQVVDAGDEGADEAEVDEGDEVGVVAGAVPGEEGEDGPDSGEDGDDEEDEDGGWSEEVLGVVYVDEVGEHAEGGDLWEGELATRVGYHREMDNGREGEQMEELTRVMISRKRQKAKKIPTSMVAAVKERRL